MTFVTLNANTLLDILGEAVKFYSENTWQYKRIEKLEAAATLASDKNIGNGNINVSVEDIQLFLKPEVDTSE